MTTGPVFVTFTGLDERVDLERAWHLSSEYPIEYGVLFSRSRAGHDPRYPSNEVLSRIMSYPFPRLSAHICGGWATEIGEGGSPSLGCDVGGFMRVQVNHRDPSAFAISMFAREWGSRGIAQTRGEFPSDTRVDWLYDCSGGRGQAPPAWPVEPGARLVGYAGGFCPENVAAFAATRGGRYWMDMESGVRTDDWLDLDKCEAVCRALFRRTR